MAPQKAAELKEKAGIQAALAPCVAEAVLSLAASAPQSPARLYVAGSLYLYQTVCPEFYKSF